MSPYNIYNMRVYIHDTARRLINQHEQLYHDTKRTRFHFGKSLYVFEMYDSLLKLHERFRMSASTAPFS
jgi:hypothetical protein